MDFRDRAQFEAERYGADPWIFVRELLQNARDAGATTVHFTTSVRDDEIRLTCRDDGDGMTQEHAKKFLFKLYASSKEGEVGAAGRFGVGFWSILRFEPIAIVIRSWPKKGAPWEITLDGDLEHAAAVSLPSGAAGTEIVLTRKVLDDVGRHVRDAAHAHARYLMTRQRKSTPLEISVDGEWITQQLDLPAPSAVFQRRGVRGVVALGASPSVELFSKGLHVRSAQSVDELLAAPDEKRGRRLDPLLEGLAPQIILDGDELNLVRSRSDARDDRALRRAVELSQRELARLIERQLAFSRPVSLWRRALRPALAVAAICTAATGVTWLLSSLISVQGPMTQRSVALTRPPAPPPPDSAPYRDPATAYKGPRVDALPARGDATDLFYIPASRELYFAGLHLSTPEQVPSLGFDDDNGEYPLVRCRGEECVRVSLTLQPGHGWVRLPVPTGHVLDRESLTWGGAPRQVYMSPAGEPIVWVANGGQSAHVSYRTGPGAAPSSDGADEPVPLPAGVPDKRDLPVEARVRMLRIFVADHVRYSNDPAVAVEHRRLAQLGYSFVDRTLKVGAGDCDVQNALFAELLKASGVPARLTIGQIGRDGTVDPLMHAWVEYRESDTNEAWRVVDASTLGQTEPPAVAGARFRAMRAKREVETPRATPTTWASDAPPGRSSYAAGTRSTPITIPMWNMPRGAWGLLGAAPLLGLMFLLARPRTKRQVQLDETHDISRLLQGALARPEAFHHVPALFEQPLIPRRGGGAISLGLAYELASKQRLYSADVGAPFTERAVKSGAVVIDAMRPEGKVVAEALGAVNLDRWDRLLRETYIPALLEKANTHLRERGEQWALMLSEAITREPAVLSVPGTKDDRWVVVNSDAPWFISAAAVAQARPAQALFQVIDQATVWLKIPAARRARLLAPLARAALLEEADSPRAQSC